MRLVGLPCRRAAGENEQRDALDAGVDRGGEQIERARPAAHRRNAAGALDTRIAVGHETGRKLVAHHDRLQPRLPRQGLAQAVDIGGGQEEDMIDAERRQGIAEPVARQHSTHAR